MWLAPLRGIAPLDTGQQAGSLRSPVRPYALALWSMNHPT
jgi:hypothetical protein